MNSELEALFAADQGEREPHPDYGTPDYGTPDYQQLRARDTLRRQRVRELVADHALATAEDYYHAAMIFQHGEVLEEIWQAHVLALEAAELGSTPARWMAAAALDRWLMMQGQPQRYGTQFVPDGTRYRLWDVDPATSDADRTAWDVPTLAHQARRAEHMTRTVPQPPMIDAPWWLRDAVKRWRQQPGDGRSQSPRHDPPILPET